jgi:hypothetical protein
LDQPRQLILQPRDSKAAEKLKLADVYLTVEPYALALPRGDEDFWCMLSPDCQISHCSAAPVWGQPLSGQISGLSFGVGRTMKQSIRFDGRGSEEAGQF